MLNLIKIISSEVDNLNRRIIKFLRFGKSDVQTAPQASPFGIDSNPVKDMIAIYAPTSDAGKTVVIGYINKNHLAGIGETRLFSTDGDGTVQTSIWLKSDGTIEVGGNSDFMVRYSKLEEAFNELKGKFNSFASAYVPGGPSSVGLPPSVSPSTADITQAKIAEIKTN